VSSKLHAKLQGLRHAFDSIGFSQNRSKVEVAAKRLVSPELDIVHHGYIKVIRK